MINEVFLRISRRSESADRATLVQTFVEAGAILALLSSTDHQIIYGRRGTGKTHALVYLAEQKLKSGDLPVYIDLRNLGSSGGLYADSSISLAERGSRLLLDTLTAIHENILDYATQPQAIININEVSDILDKLADAISEVAVVGPVEQETIRNNSHAIASEDSLSLQLSNQSAGFSLGSKNTEHISEGGSNRTKSAGNLLHRVHFGRIGTLLTTLLLALKGRRIWLLLDEWSAIPIELQPILADLLRRSILPLKNITVKIAAIEQRSDFKRSAPGNDYLGVELGADISADINLDDFMVFDNDSIRSIDFFKDLLYKHFVSALKQSEINDSPKSPDELIQSAFTQKTVFEELTRASEGVPRDFINILMVTTQRTLQRKFSAEDIRTAAHSWFQRDKQAAIQSNNEAKELLNWIIEEVIAHRKSRAFLLQANVQNELIDYLFDQRLIHILKRNIAGQDKPGVRYDVYKLDYGCYVDLLNTTRAPEGLFQLENDDNSISYAEVPQDDYRAIRRAILDLTKFFDRNMAAKN